jgi:proteic killer suppression protein
VVIVKFKTRQLEICFQEYRKASQAFGDQVARRYIQRIKIIQQTRSIDELKLLPGLRCHALKGDRKGQYAVNLTGFHRLIFRLMGNQLEIVTIEEVSKHYGD